jgi:gamma-glutamyltranspeptidase/glutathione hydrolase
MIVAPQPEAVEAGAKVLMGGGNAVDAAIACALVQGAVDPQMCGIAGIGSLQIYMPGRDVHEFIDFHGKAPAAATPEMWADLITGETRDGFGFILRDNVNDLGYQSITVPGSLKALHEAQGLFGSLTWRALVEPAIAHAESGFIVRPHVYHWWTDPLHERMGRVAPLKRLAYSNTGRAAYFDERGNAKRPGERVRIAGMARSLQRIAAGGSDVFYHGDLGAEADRDMREHGALLCAKDFEAYRTTRQAPLWGTYRGYRIATNNPPGGGVMLLEMLGILENFDLAALGHNSTEYIRVVAEAMKCATSDKDNYVGDPAFFDVPLKWLLDKERAAEIAARIRAREVFRVERVTGRAESEHTTHVSVIDRDGNAVTMTHTLGMPSGVITEGHGFMYNGCMGVFDPRPARAGSIAPGKSRFSSMCPTIIFKDDKPVMVAGAPGGTQIPMGMLQSIINYIDFGMGVQEAVNAPRFSSTSNAIDICNRIPNFTIEPLEKLGYTVIRSPQSYTFAWVHALGMVQGKWCGGADPATDGMALEV